MKKILCAVLMGVMLCVPVSAQQYDVAFPEYVPVSGGAWLEAQTSQGRVAVVVPVDYLTDTFGYLGDGYEVVNVTASTVSGTIYAQSCFSYYGSPTDLQCRFSRMGGLEVYEPYQSSYGNTSYRWTELPTTAIYNTNMDFQDDRLDRENDSYRYDTSEKIGILLFVSVVLLGGGFVVRCMLRA